MKTEMKPFPIPLVAIGPGSQAEEVELDYMAMPQGMHTYAAPILPEQQDVAGLADAQRILRAILDGLGRAAAGEECGPIDLGAIDSANLALVNQVLGEGEVSVRISGQAGVMIQEAVFAGVWRSIRKQGELVCSDQVSVGAIPAGLVAAARDCAGTPARIAIPGQLPPQVMNAPSILAEVNEQLMNWRPGMPAHVINLTLLPLSPDDIAFLDQQIGTGTVMILSRGYGNCRISSTHLPYCWRVVYYNSQDAIILNTIEIVDIPEVACAAREDLADSHERLAEVLEWVEGA